MSISRDWEAFYVKKLGGDPDVLHIVGTFDFPGLEYTVTFTPANPGVAPGTVARDVTIHEPLAGGGTQIDTRQVEHLVHQTGVQHVRIHEGQATFSMNVYDVT